MRMGVLSFLLVPPLPPCTASLSTSSRSIEDVNLNYAVSKSFHNRVSAITVKRSSRRTLKLASGVKIQDVIEGEGPEARSGDLVEFNCVCRRANGYFVFSTVDQFSGESNPVILPLDENQMIVGLKEVLTGMKVGGKRRALIPPSVGYVNENLKPIPEEFGPRRSLLSHAQEPLVFEVQLLKISSLPPPSAYN